MKLFWLLTNDNWFLFQQIYDCSIRTSFFFPFIVSIWLIIIEYWLILRWRFFLPLSLPLSSFCNDMQNVIFTHFFLVFMQISLHIYIIVTYLIMRSCYNCIITGTISIFKWIRLFYYEKLAWGSLWIWLNIDTIFGRNSFSIFFFPLVNCISVGSWKYKRGLICWHKF